MSQLDLIPRPLHAFTIRVLGEPQPAPKKQLRVLRTKRGRLTAIPYDRDFRMRTDPRTGKVSHFDKGFHRRWFNRVQNEVWKFMDETRRKPFGKGHPVAMGMLFFRSRSNSNRTAFPAQLPDFDNYAYYVTNALKACREFPNGLIFYDDCQVIWRLSPSGVLWATEQEPPGVLITVADALTIRNEINEVLQMVCQGQV